MISTNETQTDGINKTRDIYCIQETLNQQIQNKQKINNNNRAQSEGGNQHTKEMKAVDVLG